MSQLLDSVREAPAAARGARPTTTWREDLTAMIIAIWPITALFFDGRNHNNKTGQESFFSVAHVVLYTGMTVFAIYVASLIVRYQREAGADPARLAFDFKAIPVGYGVSIIGLCILGVAGPADLTWHSVYGFEINIEAIVSPPHLALFLGGLLVSSTGIRSMWAKPDIAPTMRRYLPALLSGILFIAMVNFITMYLSAWMTNVAPTKAFVHDLKRFPDVMSNQHIGLSEGLRGYGDNLFPYHYYTVGQSLASIVISTIVLLGPTLLILRRWRVPEWTFTITYLAFGAADERHDLLPRCLDADHPRADRPGDRPDAARVRPRPRTTADARRHPPGRLAGRGRAVVLVFPAARAREGHRVEADDVDRRRGDRHRRRLRHELPRGTPGLRAPPRRGRRRSS